MKLHPKCVFIHPNEKNILKTQTKQQVAFVQSSLIQENYFLRSETKFKTFDSFLRNLNQKQNSYSELSIFLW